MDYTERPLTPALSPSEGERENPRQLTGVAHVTDPSINGLNSSFGRMGDQLFPSGPWTGFYNYEPGDRHKMHLHLTFAGGSMSGDGNDDIGRFLIKGRYDAGTGECYWTKSYLGAHDVFYRGFREGKGIWGTWEITIQNHGGFHIWPREAGEGEAQSESAERAEPVEAIGTEHTLRAKALLSVEAALALWVVDREETFSIRRQKVC